MYERAEWECEFCFVETIGNSIVYLSFPSASPVTIISINIIFTDYEHENFDSAVWITLSDAQQLCEIFCCS